MLFANCVIFLFSILRATLIHSFTLRTTKVSFNRFKRICTAYTESVRSLFTYLYWILSVCVYLIQKICSSFLVFIISRACTASNFISISTVLYFFLFHRYAVFSLSLCFSLFMYSIAWKLCGHFVNCFHTVFLGFLWKKKLYALARPFFWDMLLYIKPVLYLSSFPPIYFYFHLVSMFNIFVIVLLRERERGEEKGERKKRNWNCVGQFNLSPATFEIIECAKPIKIVQKWVQTTKYNTTKTFQYKRQTTSLKTKEKNRYLIHDIW